MDEIRQKLVRGQLSIGDAIVKALPELRKRLPDQALAWFVDELQGYSNSITFYQGDQHNLPAYRAVKGTLKLMSANGQLTELKHPFANRGQFFLSAPVAWLEEFACLPGDEVLAELPDLTALLGRTGGNVVCQLTKEQLTRMLITIRGKVIELMEEAKDKEIKSLPSLRDKK